MEPHSFYYITVPICEIGITLASIWGIIFGLKHLKHLSKDQKLAGVGVVVQIEGQMCEREIRFNEKMAAWELAVANNTPNQQILKGLYDQSRRSWFNSIDRLCYCIRHEHLSDIEWKKEYQIMLHDIIRSNPSDFAAGSPFNNMIELDKKWT